VAKPKAIADCVLELAAFDACSAWLESMQTVVNAVATTPVAPKQSHRRRLLLLPGTCVLLGAVSPPRVRADDAAALSDLFSRASDATGRGDYDTADELWTRAVEAAPGNSAAVSNRGTARLQAGRLRDAREDLELAVQLDAAAGRRPDALALNNLGNAMGACGDWTGAIEKFQEAAVADARLTAIARANQALAYFQTGDDVEALRTARALLRRDSEFWDMRALAASILWAQSEESAAESEWLQLCRSGRGFGANRSAEPQPGESTSQVAYSARLLQQQLALVTGVVAGTTRDNGSDTPCRLYSDTSRVQARWPPRATAALDAFLRLKREGSAIDYDGKLRTFTFT